MSKNNQSELVADFEVDIISSSVANQAIEWMLELQDEGLSTDQHQPLKNWRQQDPEHERAWQRIEHLNSKFSSLSSSVGKAVTYAGIADNNKHSRRDSMKALALLLFAGSSTLLLEQQFSWQNIMADAKTDVGQRKTITLADGTTVDLNTDTAISIHFTELERRIRLHNGEVLIATAKDNSTQSRPFIVETPHGELQPIGTKFNVYLRDKLSRLIVLEGAVEVRPKDINGEFETITAQQQVSFDRSHIYAVEAANEDSVAWRSGMIVASGMRLADFLVEVSRHRSGVLRCEPSAANLRVSGTYPLDDTTLILNSLANTLPLDVYFLTSLWVTVKLKPT